MSVAAAAGALELVERQAHVLQKRAFAPCHVLVLRRGEQLGILLPRLEDPAFLLDVQGIVLEHLGVGEATVVVDRDVHELPADRAACAAGRVDATWPVAAGCASSDAFARTAFDSAELLDVDVYELARPLDRIRRVLILVLVVMAIGAFTIPFVADFFLLEIPPADYAVTIALIVGTACTLISLALRAVGVRSPGTAGIGPGCGPAPR